MENECNIDVVKGIGTNHGRGFEDEKFVNFFNS